MTTLAEWRRQQPGKVPGRTMSQTELAERLGLSRSYLSEIETGAKEPPLRVAVAIEGLTGGSVKAASFIVAEAHA